MASNNNDDDDDFGSLSSEPIAWILIPIVVFFFVGVIATMCHIRRRRRRRLAAAQWPSSSNTRVFTPHGEVIIVRQRGTTTSRWYPWVASRSQEGLNELGEAPPPYDGKKQRQNDSEMRDLEAGEQAPPDYPAAPAPAVTTESRRSR